MVLTYDQVKDKPSQLLACTGLTRAEFEILRVAFQKAWVAYVEQTYIKDKARQRRYGGGRKARLSQIEDKLLFILFYYKTYPLQAVQGLVFGLSQGQANEWIHTLSSVLHTALGYQKQLPERQAANLETVLQGCDWLEFIIDGTERPRERPSKTEAQKTYYSGKKNAYVQEHLDH